jgi:hypothetical protein
LSVATACSKFTIIQPPDAGTVSSPVNFEIAWNEGMQPGSYKVIVTNTASMAVTDITSQFAINCQPQNTGCTSTASVPLPAGSYTLNASGNLWFIYLHNYSSQSASSTFTVVGPGFSLSAPAITVTRGTSKALTISVSPSGGFTGPVAVTIAGLPTGVTATPAAFTLASGTLMGTTMIAASATAPLGSTTPSLSGTSGSISSPPATFNLTVAAPSPTIASAAPSSQSRGGTVVITGTNFDPVCANNSVVVGTASATPTACSATSITFAVPATAPFGATTVKVITNGVSSTTLPFRVTRAAGPFVEITADISGQTTNRTCTPGGTIKVEVCSNCGYAAPFAATFKTVANNAAIGSTIEFHKNSAGVAGLGGAGFSLCTSGIVLDGDASAYQAQLMNLQFRQLPSGTPFLMGTLPFNYGTPSGTASYVPRILRSADGTIIMVVTASSIGPSELTATFIDQGTGGSIIKTVQIQQVGSVVSASISATNTVSWTVATTSGTFVVP